MSFTCFFPDLLFTNQPHPSSGVAMKPVRTLLAAAIAAFAFNAHAVSIATDGSWNEFDFDAVGSSLYDLGSLDTSFTFTLNQASLLRVVDAVFSGDQFTIVANGNTLGTTSAPTVQEIDSIFDAATAWNDSRFSKGEWSLAAGTYTITGSATLSPFNSGFGYLSVTAVPEPESYAMLLAGLGLMGVIARRRNRNV
jgi:hypothetical protein